MKFIIALVYAAASSTALAAEGVLEINQACASVGCFPGDTAGFPVTIVSAGSYRLTSNLSAATTSGISVAANGVQLDLGGFTISGPVVCNGTPVTCTPSSYGPAGVVVAGSSEGVVVRNGHVKGFGYGIFSGPSNLVEDVIASSNADSGIKALGGTTVRRSTGVRNGRLGISIGIGGQVIDSVANSNGQFGFASGGTPTNGGATIRNSSAFDNNGYGIYDWGRSLIEGCVINGNAGIGIYVENGGSSLMNNIVTKSGAGGIEIGVSTAFEPGGVHTTLSGNSLTGNNGGSAAAQITGAGLKLFLGQNLCGTAVCGASP